MSMNSINTSSVPRLDLGACDKAAGKNLKSSLDAQISDCGQDTIQLGVLSRALKNSKPIHAERIRENAETASSAPPKLLKRVMNAICDLLFHPPEHKVLKHYDSATTYLDKRVNRDISSSLPAIKRLLSGVKESITGSPATKPTWDRGVKLDESKKKLTELNQKIEICTDGNLIKKMESLRSELTMASCELSGEYTQALSLIDDAKSILQSAKNTIDEFGGYGVPRDLGETKSKEVQAKLEEILSCIRDCGNMNLKRELGKFAEKLIDAREALAPGYDPYAQPKGN